MIKKLFFLILSFIFSLSATAGELNLSGISVSNLEKLYHQVGYNGIENKSWLMLSTHKYPAIFLNKFPADFNSIQDIERRNALFIKILTPLALKLNRELTKERQQIIALKSELDTNGKLSPSSLNLLEKKATKYDVFTRLKDQKRYIFLINELLNRIDIIPPSIMITLAAVETDFGSSRIVKEGNSLYKLLAWHTKSGLKPIGETEDDSYRIKVYPSIYASMQDFALRLNSNINFEFFRTARANSLSAGKSPYIPGSTLIAYTFSNSELNNYAGLIEYTLAYYELASIDKATLDFTVITPQIVKQYNKNSSKK